MTVAQLRQALEALEQQGLGDKAVHLYVGGGEPVTGHTEVAYLGDTMGPGWVGLSGYWDRAD